MATPVLVGSTTVYIPPDLQKTQSDVNKTNAFTDFVKKNIKDLKPAKTYLVQFKWVFEDGSKSRDWSPSYRFSTPAAPPLTPTGFTAKKILGGITVSWAGQYLDGVKTDRFKGINIYAGTSATATAGTYTFVGQLTVDAVNNTITIPVDSTTENPSGVYVRYSQPIYIHAQSSNLDDTLGTFVANQASVLTGAGKATDADINDNAITYDKLAANVLTVGNLKAGTINATSFIRAGSKDLANGTGARIEIASNTVEDGTYDILPGITIYDTGGNQIFRADLLGNLTIGGYATTSSVASKANTDMSNVTSISGGIINTGTIKSNNYIFQDNLPPNADDTTTADGSGFSDYGTAINLINGTITSPQFRIDTSGNAYFKGLVQAGTMSFGPGVLSGSDGILLDNDDYWWSTGQFSLGGGSITYTGTNLSIAGALTYNQVADTLTFDTTSVAFSTGSGTFNSDNNNYAGDQTLTITPTGALTKGRRLIYNGTTTPSSVSLTNGEGTFTHFNAGSVPVKVGDLLFTT